MRHSHLPIVFVLCLTAVPVCAQETKNPAAATSTDDAAVVDDEAVFDTIKLGDSRDTVEKKLKASKLLEMTINELYLARVGLNGSFRTKQKIGGLQCLLSFTWDGQDRLKELSLDTEAQPVANYDTSLKATWTMLINLMSTLHGKPLQGVDYPNSTTLQNGMTLNTHVWELKPSGTALLGTSKLATGYMVSVRFTQEKIQPVRFGE